MLFTILDTPLVPYQVYGSREHNTKSPFVVYKDFPRSGRVLAQHPAETRPEFYDFSVKLLVRPAARLTRFVQTDQPPVTNLE